MIYLTILLLFSFSIPLWANWDLSHVDRDRAIIHRTEGAAFLQQHNLYEYVNSQASYHWPLPNNESVTRLVNILHTEGDKFQIFFFVEASKAVALLTKIYESDRFIVNQRKIKKRFRKILVTSSRTTIPFISNPKKKNPPITIDFPHLERYLPVTPRLVDNHRKLKQRKKNRLRGWGTAASLIALYYTQVDLDRENRLYKSETDEAKRKAIKSRATRSFNRRNLSALLGLIFYCQHF